MKKIIVLLLCISLLLVFTGCPDNQPLPTTEPTIDTLPTESVSNETTVETQPVYVENIPLLAFSAPIITQQQRADDGTTLFSYSYQNISLILEDPQIADAIMIDYLNLVDYENSSAKHTLSDAQSAYTGQAEWVPYSFSVLFSTARFDASVLSLYGTHALYNGSPRPTAANTAVTYDLMTGRQLELRNVLVADFSADTLSELICSALSEPESQGMLYSDYAYVVSELFSTNKPVENWYLSADGLCFFFAPYEIAPYSAGTIIAEIPYAELIGLLKDEYFPAEKIELSGTVHTKPLQDADLSQFSQFAELIVDENGSEYLLYTDGCLQNVRIEIGSWLEDESFHAEATVFAAATLCSSDGLMIQLSQDMAQSLRLTYEENGQVISYDLASFIASN